MTSAGETSEVQGIIQAVSLEGELGAPAGNCYIKLDNHDEPYLASVGLALKVNQEIKAKTYRGKDGPVLLEVEVIREPTRVEEAQYAAAKLHNSEGKFMIVPLAQIQESPWNPNEMDAQTFKALVVDMQHNGQYAVNLLDLFAVGHDEHGIIRYQIADGHSRFRAARKLGWKEIRAIVYDMDENTAKIHNYRKNRERGTLNATKEAELFQEEAERGLTQQEIADKYGVSQQYVSDRLRTLPLYATGVKPSHAEEITRKLEEPKVRETVAKVAVKRHLTPEETCEVAKRVRDDLKDKPKVTKRFVRVKAEQHAKEVKSPRFQPKPDHEFHCPRCKTDQAVFCGGARNHRVVVIMQKPRCHD
jgi:ParB/RepB/Spo0J family partition protein